jgi:DNA-binding CsgD family transcriptional regulator
MLRLYKSLSEKLKGFLNKSFGNDRPVAQRENFDLSDREKEILSCLVKGMSYKLIADACFISIDTVRGHIRNIYEKLHVHSKGEAVAKAIISKIV